MCQSPGLPSRPSERTANLGAEFLWSVAVAGSGESATVTFLARAVPPARHRSKESNGAFVLCYPALSLIDMFANERT